MKKILAALLVSAIVFVSAATYAQSGMSISSVTIEACSIASGAIDKTRAKISVIFGATEGAEQIAVLLATEKNITYSEQTENKILYIDQIEIQPNQSFEFVVEKSKLTAALGTEEVVGKSLFLTAYSEEFDSEATYEFLYSEPVADYLCGDTNADGKVNALDSAALSRYIGAWDGIEIDFRASDVNADGKVNALDSAVLKRHIANWTDYLVLPH